MYALSTIIFIVILILLLLSNRSTNRTAKVKEGKV